MPALAEGQRLADRYTLKRRLGRGGMSEVWLAADTRRDCDVALKTATGGEPGRVQHLEAEWRALHRLAHPNLVPVGDFHGDADPPFFTMEYLAGGDFRRYVGRPPEVFLPPLIQALGGLVAMHEQGIVHRDIKAANILLTADGRPCIADLGLSSPATEGGLRSGGSAYSMSPQQLDGEPPTVADDIYALGALLYELITGRPPLHPDVTEARVRGEIPPPPGQGPLADLVSAMLAKTADGRPATVREIRDQLESLATDVADNPTQPPYLTAPDDAEVEHVRIQPAVLSGTAPMAGPATAGGGAGLRWVGVWAAVAALAALAAVVFVYLPATVKPRPPLAVAPPTPAPTRPTETGAPPAAIGLSPYQLAQLAEKRGQAERELKALLRSQSRLEERNVTVWAADAFAAARAEAQEGDVLFRERSYEEAAARYREAARQLEALLADADQVLADAMAAAWTAFEGGDSAAARDAFEYVLAIAPENAEASRGLERTAGLDELVALMKEGARQESAGQLADAAATFRRAAALDGEFRPAAAAVARVTERIGDVRFNELLSRGYAALERKDYPTARRAFADAAARRPGSAAAQAGLEQVVLEDRLDSIRALRAEAEAHESGERWVEARGSYEALLAMDDTLVFAREGRSRADRRATLDARLTELVEHPERLATDSVYEEAKQLMQQASAEAESGPRMATQVRRLARLIATARTPIKVTLLSDNQTEVVVYKVDRLGQFSQRELALRPGKYTAVGTREGFRDVRREFTLVAGQSPEPVVVRCEERI